MPTDDAESSERCWLLISVQSGMHQGALAADTGRGVLIGQAATCDLVLMDAGVPSEALRLATENGAIVVEALGEGVESNGEPLRPGRTASGAESLRLNIAGVRIGAELIHRRHSPTQAPSTKRRSRLPYLVGGTALAGVLAVAAAAAVAPSDARTPGDDPSRSLEQVIADFNARGASITIAAGHTGPVLQGVVADAAARTALDKALTAAGARADVRVQSARLMTESLDRMARLAGHGCEARHLGGGRFDCGLGLPDASAVQRMHELAAQVPGVQSLALRAAPPAEVVPKPPPEPSPLPPLAVITVPDRPKPPLPSIRHVAIGPRGGLAIDSSGRTLRVGDEFEGGRVVAIRFNALEVAYQGRRYSVAVGTALDSPLITQP